MSILRLLKKKSGLTATERAVGRYTRAPFAKRKRIRAVCTMCPGRKVGESQGELELHLGKRGRDQSESIERKECTPQ